MAYICKLLTRGELVEAVGSLVPNNTERDRLIDSALQYFSENPTKDTFKVKGRTGQGTKMRLTIRRVSLGRGVFYTFSVT